MQFNFCEIMAALKVLYSKVHEVIATDLPQSKTICLSWKMLFLLRDFWLSFAYSLVENIFIVYYAWAFFRILLGWCIRQMKCFAVGCFAWWRHFMNHSASVFCFLLQIRVFIVLNLAGIFNCKYEMKNEIESGISNSKTTLLCKWPILWEIVRRSKKV